LLQLTYQKKNSLLIFRLREFNTGNKNTGTFGVMYHSEILRDCTNFAKLEVFVKSLQAKPKILITETWIQSSIFFFNNLEGFNFASNSRKACKGGVIVIYVKIHR